MLIHLKIQRIQSRIFIFLLKVSCPLSVLWCRLSERRASASPWHHLQKSWLCGGSSLTTFVSTIPTMTTFQASGVVKAFTFINCSKPLMQYFNNTVNIFNGLLKFLVSPFVYYFAQVRMSGQRRLCRTMLKIPERTFTPKSSWRMARAMTSCGMQRR